MSTRTQGESEDRREREDRGKPAIRRTGATLVVLRFEAERRLRSTATLAVAFTLFGALFVWIGPRVTAGGGFDQLLETLPPAMVALLGFETLGSLDGLLGGEFYTFTWVVGLGAYLAYSAAGSVAGDIGDDRMDTLLAAPVSRTSVLLGKYLSLLVPVVALNVVVPLALYAGSVVVDDPLSLVDLAALHALSVPYLLCWGAVGLLLGVAVRGGRTAGRVALGVVIAAWLVESFVVGTDVEWLGALSPMRYFEPSAVLVGGSYDYAGATLLFAVAVAAVAVGRARFARADL